MKKIKVWRIIWISIICVILSVILAICIGWFVLFGNIEGFQLPQDATVVLQVRGPFNRYTGMALPHTQLCFYDQDGNILGAINETEVTTSYGFVEGGGHVFHFFKNHTVVIGREGTEILENASGITMTYVSFQPDEVGYIDELETAWALLNVGTGGGGNTYRNVIRFATADSTYDVVLPYYLTEICYDVSARRFIATCQFELPEGYTFGDIVYITLEYDEASGQFYYDEAFELPDGFARSGTRGYEYLMSKDNILYVVAANMIETARYEFTSRLYLEVYDLTTMTGIAQYTLLDYYEGTAYGPVMSPYLNLRGAIEAEGKLYVFLPDSRVCVIEDENNIEFLSMPFEFEGALNMLVPERDVSRDSFDGSLATIGEDGKIYILNQYPDGTVRIHRLNDDGTYELFWEAEIPMLLNISMHTGIGYAIRGFMILPTDKS